MKLLTIFKKHFELDKPKCLHLKLYRLPHNVLLCPECFRCFDVGAMWFNIIALDDNDLEKLFELRKKALHLGRNESK